MSEKHISKLINGSVLLAPDMAVRLEMLLGIPAKFWNNLEAIYKEKLIKAEAEQIISFHSFHGIDKNEKKEHNMFI